MDSKSSPKKYLWILLIILLIGAAVLIFWLLSRQDNGLTYNYVAAKAGDIKQEVQGSGQVKSAQDLQLSFQISGQVQKSLVSVGQSVKAGDVLATLDSNGLSAQLSQAQAALASAKAQLERAKAAYQAQSANLANLKNGPSAADLNLSQAQINSAQQGVNDAQTSLENIKSQNEVSLSNQYSQAVNLINNAYATAFAAVNTQLTPLFSDQHTDHPQLTFNSTDAQLEVNVKSELVTIESGLNDWNSSLNNLKPEDFKAVDTSLDNSLSQLNNLANFLRDMSTLLSDSLTSASPSQSTITSYKNSVNTALASVNSIILSLNNQKNAIKSQKAANQELLTQASSKLNQAQKALSVAQKAYDLKKSGATPDQIAAQEAVVAQAKAGIDTEVAAVAAAQAKVRDLDIQLAKTKLIAPIDGVISVDNIKIGQNVSPNAPLVTLLSQAKYQLDIQIPESQIAPVKVGQTASITLDAYGSQPVLQAKVISIDPASTVINGVNSYKVTLEFVNEYPELKVGMSAQARILTSEDKTALIVPASSIIKSGNQDYVIVDNGSSAGQKQIVQIGITSLDGQTEILSGLKAGAKVASFGAVGNN